MLGAPESKKMAGAFKLNAFKKTFFDRIKVEKAVERARLKNLSKCGAFVRTAARSSLRRRKKTSLPGMPPSVHSKDAFATLKNILFGYDAATKGVIVGPVGINGNKSDVPRLMEKGGNARRRMRYTVERTKTGKQKKRLVLKRHLRAQLSHYEARPFMWPALKREKAKFAKVWKNSVKATG